MAMSLIMMSQRGRRLQRSIREIRRVAEDAAKAGGGEYDGWEAAAAP